METLQAVPRIIELFDSTCISQFESMGCKIAQVDKTSLDEALITAHIQAASEDISVTLLLSSSSQLLEQTMPSDNQELVLDVAMQEDWNLELANRFVARLKNKLLSHNCVLKMGLPKSCDDVEALKNEHNSVDKFVRNFVVHGEEKTGAIECCLFIELTNKEFVLEDYEDEDEAWFTESELDNL